ncbi:MAG TPA: hypothetical protein VFS29_02415 [Motilibacteraceae bacterium]|nr:hypothetical protein [Motilibacteraceae bacterium]
MSTTAPGPSDRIDPSQPPGGAGEPGQAGRSDQPGQPLDPRLDASLDAALRQLVVDGVLAAHQARLTAAALAEAVPTTAPAPSRPAPMEAASLRARLAEVAGYAGGALVATGVGLFLGSAWQDLSRAARVGWLAGIAAVLVLAGVAVLATARMPVSRLLPELRAGGLPVRRRLASALWALAAGTAGAATAVALEPDTPLPAVLVALPLVVAGYAVAPAVIGHAAAFAAVVLLAVSSLQEAGVDASVPYAVVLLAVAALWAAATLTGVLRERVLGLAVATGLAFAAAMIPAGDEPWLSHAIGAVLAVLLFAGYVRLRAWPLLAGAVLTTTVVAAQLTSDLLGGQTSRAVVVLVAGVVLLASSALGLRLRGQERDGGQGR